MKPINLESAPIDSTNESQLAFILKQSGKPWILDILEAMETTNTNPEDLLKTLFLLGNVKRFTKWGKIIWVIQNGMLTRIQEEQGFNLISKEK